MKLEDIVDSSVLDKLRKEGIFCIEGRGVTFTTEYVKALVDFVMQEKITLTGLSLPGCGISSDSVEFICKLKDLQFLDLSENNLVRNDIQTLRRELPNLKDADFSYNPGDYLETAAPILVFSSNHDRGSDFAAILGVNPSALSVNTTLTPPKSK